MTKRLNIYSHNAVRINSWESILIKTLCNLKNVIKIPDTLIWYEKYLVCVIAVNLLHSTLLHFGPYNIHYEWHM